MRYNDKNSCTVSVKLQGADIVNKRLQHEKTLRIRTPRIMAGKTCSVCASGKKSMRRFNLKNTPLLRNGLIALGFLVFVLLWLPVNARAACQVQFTGQAAQMFGSTPRGNFSTLAACQNYINNSPGFEKKNSHCIGSCSGTSGGISSGGGGFSIPPGATPGQAMALGIMGSFLNAALAPPAGPSREEIARKQAQEAEEFRIAEEKRRYEEEMRLAEQERQKQGRLALASGMQGVDGQPIRTASGSGPTTGWKVIDDWNEDARRKQLAECPVIAEKIALYENGIRHIDEVMARNERMIRESEGDRQKAGEDLSKVKADLTAETLSMGLKSFVQTQKNLQNMRNALDKLGKRGNSGEMSYEQIVQAQKWLERGLTHGQNVIDLTEKSLQYYENTSLRGNRTFLDSPYSEKLKIALKDFNDKFMCDAGGWEFVGEHVAEASGGTAGEIAFKLAVAGIKATAAGIGMKLSGDQLHGFNENQVKMGIERYRLEQRIDELKTSFINNRCPKQ